MQLPVNVSPGVEKNGLHVEKNEDHGDQIEFDRKGLARIARGSDAALIGLHFDLARPVPPDQAGEQEDHARKRHRNQEVNQQGGVGLGYVPRHGRTGYNSGEGRHGQLIGFPVGKREYNESTDNTMSIGYNSKLERADGTYDVQTEDRGSAHPFIDTVVLLSGQVLHKRSVSYSDLLADGTADPDIVRERVQGQHLEILEALRSGSLPLRQAVSAENAIQVKLLNPTGWLLKGKVTLDIQVLTRNGGHAVTGADVEAIIEGAAGAPARFAGKCDNDGRVRLEFAFPQLADPNAAALVISARADRAQDHIRYNLKPIPAAQAPPTR